ncbi:GspMb/PilO family protein [Bacillus testis]|uniref:GspMb/PilO family protein n=1 Tax=Bacillus testis TaxID=1622072 RepID=UPI00067F6AAD|nr:GspMb/PilO family protein [Bacillus testis]
MMNASLSKKQMLIVVGASLLAAIVIAVLFFWKVYPMQNSIVLKEQELRNQENVVAALQSKAKPVQEVSFEKSTQLQKKLPVKPLVQQIVMNIEKAETISNSFVQNMSFSEDGTGGEGESNTVSAAQPGVEGLQKMTVTLNVQSPTYKELNAFLSTIEGMQRILTIDNLTFTGEEEVTSIEQSAAPLDYSLTVSAYYAPALQDLEKDLPAMDKPQPGRKANPFNNHEDSDQ